MIDYLMNQYMFFLKNLLKDIVQLKEIRTFVRISEEILRKMSGLIRTFFNNYE